MNTERMYKILLGAHISEKATVIADEANQFAFKVARDATRPEIKEAVEKIYSVVVKNVTVLNVKGKVKRNARGVSRKPSWKKAYVRLEEGHEIDFASIGS
ncbi:MAG: 50S ribosomal protein L23 [bacterium]|nr:50S ribosomal protein L23 [Gammaproteobacteria bacterium]HIL94513.1 50S ribosomal protein L23 [Pseudomonadales bacterium]